MGTTFEELRDAAMQLPIEDRAVLAEILEESLLTDEQRTIRAEWNALAERRSEEIHTGKAKTIPAAESLARARAALVDARKTARRG